MKKHLKQSIAILVMLSTIFGISSCGDQHEGVQVKEKLTDTQNNQNKKRYIYEPFISIRGEEQNCLYYHRKTHQVVTIIDNTWNSIGGSFDVNNYMEDGNYCEYYEGKILQINEENPGHFNNEEAEEKIEEEMNIEIKDVTNDAQKYIEKYHYIYGPYVSIVGEEKNGLFYNKRSHQVVIIHDRNFGGENSAIGVVDYLQNGKHCSYIDGEIVELEK